MADSAQRGPLAAQLLALWDEVAEVHPARRALTVLRFADPSATEEEISGLTVGEADRRMLELRRAAFGDSFDALSKCPQCDETIELSFRSGDFPDTSPSRAQSIPQQIETREYAVEFRAPTLGDLVTVSSFGNAADAELALLERCVTSVNSSHGTAVSARSLPREVVEKVGAALEKSDPLSCTRVQLACPACSHEWSALLNMSEYLWLELDNWAKGILGDVHLLAGAYGWSEAEILSLSPRRRSEYLERVLA